MRIALVSDAWLPQINGVVRTLMRTMDEIKARGHEMQVFSPDLFRNLPCPTYNEIRLAVLPARRLAALLDAFQPCAIHIATEGPLGHAARRYCLARRLPIRFSATGNSGVARKICVSSFSASGRWLSRIRLAICSKT